MLAAALVYMYWNLVHCAPLVLSRLLPRGITYVGGISFFIFAVFSAYLAAHGLREPDTMLHCFLQGFVGLWFALATTAAARGSEGDEVMLRRLFGMMSLLMLSIIASLYVYDPRLMASINLMLIAGGFWLTTNYFQYLDRGR
jgi:hypothetical protein